MKLKRLEILGFKSFKDKTRFDFSEGISGIIGPNGCGKSNVVDAIRWVMGEQRVKALRGKKMDDVIFNGSADAAPISMAEVSITLEKNGRSFPGQYEEHSEVSISRRIFRNGDTEYYINKTPCRLLDVKEFFMDTGVGARTYSIVEQESISKLVEAKPDDIREFVEEAAGIKKYKSRRESAARKMESTKQNIERLKDITGEVKTQMNSTSRQAKRAERYRALKKSVKETELALSLQAYLDLTDRLESRTSVRTELNDTLIAAQTEVKTLESVTEEIKLDLAEAERTIAQLQEQFYGSRNEISINEQKIGFFTKKIADIKDRTAKNLQSIDLLHERRNTVQHEIENSDRLIAESEQKIAEVKETIRTSEEAVNQLKTAEKTVADKLEAEKSRYFSIAAEQARLKNMLQSLTKGVDDLKKKAERETRELRENTDKLSTVQHNLANVRVALESDTHAGATLKETEGIVKRNIDEARLTLEELDQKIAETREEISIKSSRLASLREFQEGYEWCNDGTKSILEARKGGIHGDGIYGLVADHISAPREYEAAVEAVLGDKLQYVVVESQEHGIEAIEYLKKSSSGRSNFVPLQARGISSGNQSFDHLTGVVKLNDFVQVKEEFKDIVESLLGDVLLIPDLHTGMGLWRRNGFCGTFVTPDGDMISPHGTLTGGSRINSTNSLLRNKREVSELEHDLDYLTTLRETDTSRRYEVSTRIDELTDELEEIRTEMHQSELAINGRNKDVERLETEIKWFEQRINVLSFNKESIEAEQSDAHAKIAGTEQDLAVYAREEQERSSALAALEEKWRGIRTDLEAREKTLTDRKILITSLDEKRTASISARARLVSTITDISREIETNTRDSETAEAEVLELTGNIKAATTQLETLYTQHEAAEQKLANARDLHGEKENVLRAKEIEIREAKTNLDTLVKQLNKLDMEIRELSVHRDTLKKGVAEKFYVDLMTQLPDFQKLAEDEVKTLRSRLNDDRKRIEYFGEVNLLALREHEELKERHDFLSGQIDDLNASLDTLQKTINRMNRISKKRFADTFEAIDQSFQEVFPRLFPGGKGRLMLTDESDMMSTGVDIDITIPGKKRQSISLLSGGEKALSAVALIFAILAYKPSPFLILDEVDAALDDTNVTLFKNLLKEISGNSQIIFVTHNKRTMEAADSLFGITMEKKGITSTVAVSLN